MTDGRLSPVLDASALLAYLRREPGGAIVRDEIGLGAIINSVNYAEALSRLVDIGELPDTLSRGLRERGFVGDLLEVVPLTEEDSVMIAQLRSLTRARGLSLGDRACLATGIRLRRPVITADRGWAELDVGISIRLIRP